MKFQNPSFKGFFLERTDTRTHARTHGRTSRKQYALHFFKVGGIINVFHTNADDVTLLIAFYRFAKFRRSLSSSNSLHLWIFNVKISTNSRYLLRKHLP